MMIKGFVMCATYISSIHQNWLDTFKLQSIKPLKLIWSVKRLQTEFLNSDYESDDNVVNWLNKAFRVWYGMQYNLICAYIII